jgi:hypothetical protein
MRRGDVFRIKRFAPYVCCIYRKQKGEKILLCGFYRGGILVTLAVEKKVWQVIHLTHFLEYMEAYEDKNKIGIVCQRYAAFCRSDECGSQSLAGGS